MDIGSSSRRASLPDYYQDVLPAYQATESRPLQHPQAAHVTDSPSNSQTSLDAREEKRALRVASEELGFPPLSQPAHRTGRSDIEMQEVTTQHRPLRLVHLIPEPRFRNSRTVLMPLSAIFFVAAFCPWLIFTILLPILVSKDYCTNKTPELLSLAVPQLAISLYAAILLYLDRKNIIRLRRRPAGAIWDYMMLATVVFVAGVFMLNGVCKETWEAAAADIGN